MKKETPMEMHPVESSQIKSLGFDPVTKQMAIEFKPGSIYQYDNVDQDLFNSFIAAESKGIFFASVIKPNPTKFPFVKIRPSDRELAKQNKENGDGQSLSS